MKHKITLELDEETAEFKVSGEEHCHECLIKTAIVILASNCGEGQFHKMVNDWYQMSGADEGSVH